MTPSGVTLRGMIAFAGGTIARYVQEGHEVVMCNATLGDRGSFEHTSEEIARIRLGEARRAAEIAGADHLTLGLSDGDINAADRDQIRAVVDLVRSATLGSYGVSGFAGGPVDRLLDQGWVLQPRDLRRLPRVRPSRHRYSMDSRRPEPVASDTRSRTRLRAHHLGSPEGPGEMSNDRFHHRAAAA